MFPLSLSLIIIIGRRRCMESIYKVMRSFRIRRLLIQWPLNKKHSSWNLFPNVWLTNQELHTRKLRDHESTDALKWKNSYIFALNHPWYAAFAKIKQFFVSFWVKEFLSIELLKSLSYNGNRLIHFRVMPPLSLNWLDWHIFTLIVIF